MVTPQCPLCHTDADPMCQVTDLNRQLSRVVFHYFRCPRCGLIFMVDPPVDMSRYYPIEYYSLPTSAQAVAETAELERYKIEIVQRFVRGGRLIEIGPGRGNFCYLAREAGFEVAAIERDAACCTFLNDALGIAAIGGGDEYAALGSVASADVIAMWHVIEHLSSPWRFLELAASKLNVGGILIVATPNPGALQFRLFGKRWTHLDAPRHLNLIPSRLLASRLEAGGLRTVLLTTTDPGSLGWNAFGWSYSCANFFSGSAARRIARLAGRVLARAASGIEGAEGRGTAYTGVFRRARA